MVKTIFVTTVLIYGVQLTGTCLRSNSIPGQDEYRFIPPWIDEKSLTVTPPKFRPTFYNVNCGQPKSTIPGPGCGAQVLANVDRVFVRQKDTRKTRHKNTYHIYDSTGREILRAEEVPNLLTSMLDDHTRPFEILLKNARGETVIQLIRPRTYFRRSTRSVQVYSPPGIFVGTVVEDRTHWFPLFKAKNDKDQTVFFIKGTKAECSYLDCPIYNYFNFNFNFTDYHALEFSRILMEDVEIGRISNQWAGYYQEYFTEADNYVISFSQEMGVNSRIVLIAGCILIDFMYFENTIENHKLEERKSSTSISDRKQ